MTRILRASFAAGEQLSGNSAEEQLGKASYKHETRTVFGSDWGTEYGSVVGDNGTKAELESPRLTIERWMADESMHGVPMRGTAAAHDSFNAPSQRPSTSSGRIISR